MSSEEERLEAAWAAFDAGDAEGALELLERLRARSARSWVLESQARAELGDLEGARSALERARSGGLSAHDSEYAWARASLLLLEWRFEEALSAFEDIARREPGPEVLERISFCCELNGDLARADALYRQASRADPDFFTPIPRLSESAFESVVKEAIERLPEEFRELLLETEVVVAPVPSRELLGGGSPADTPPDLLGLFVGPSRLELVTSPGGEPTPVVYLFQRNLERAARDREELLEEIAVTLYHELGHLLGFDEEGVADLGLD